MSNKTINYCPRPKWERWPGSNRCPNCGGAEIEYNTQIILTSYPPQSQLRCKSCGHIFSSGIESNHDMQWHHDQSILSTPYIGDPPQGTMPQIGDWPFGPSIPEPPSYPDIYIPDKDSKVGWICPKCGKVNAPHRDFCDCSGGGYYPNIVYCNGTVNNPNSTPTTATSQANFQMCGYLNTRYANKEKTTMKQDADLKDIIAGKGIKNADTNKTDGPGIYKEMHYD